jgi:large subunit ribosomal protein L10
MNREQKTAAIAEIAGHIDESDAIFAVDYRGITVAEVADLRAKLREADATFKVVKNSLTERAADQAGAEQLKDFLSGPTALTFVRGDVAMAAKAVADYARATQLLPFKGGVMEGATLDVEQIRALSRLPAREVLYGQLVGVVASPIGGLVRSLNALLGGLAVALGQVQAKKESGEIPAGDAPAAEAPAAEGEQAGAAAPEGDGGEEAPAAEVPAEAHAGEESSAGDADAAAGEEQPDAEAQPAAGEDAAPAGEEAPAAEEPASEAAPAAQDDEKTEPEAEASEQKDANQADVSAQEQPEDAETNPTKED